MLWSQMENCLYKKFKSHVIVIKSFSWLLSRLITSYLEAFTIPKPFFLITSYWRLSKLSFLFFPLTKIYDDKRAKYQVALNHWYSQAFNVILNRFYKFVNVLFHQPPFKYKILWMKTHNTHTHTQIVYKRKNIQKKKSPREKWKRKFQNKRPNL